MYRKSNSIIENNEEESKYEVCILDSMKRLRRQGWQRIQFAKIYATIIIIIKIIIKIIIIIIIIIRVFIRP